MLPYHSFKKQLLGALCRDPIFDFAWQQTKTGMEAMTVSSDGTHVAVILEKETPETCITKLYASRLKTSCTLSMRHKMPSFLLAGGAAGDHSHFFFTVHIWLSLFHRQCVLVGHPAPGGPNREAGPGAPRPCPAPRRRGELKIIVQC